MSSVRLARTVGVGVAAGGVVRRRARRRAPAPNADVAPRRRPEHGERRRCPSARRRWPARVSRSTGRDGVVPRLHRHDGAGLAAAAASPSSSVGPGRTSASRKTSAGAGRGGGAGPAGVRLADPPGRQRRGRDHDVRRATAATAAVASVEWSSTTTSSSPGRSWAAQRASSGGSAAASSRAGTTTASGRPVPAGGGQRAGRPQQQPPERPPGGVERPAQRHADAATSGVRRTASSRTSPLAVHTRPMADRPRRQEQEPAADEVTEVAPGVLRCPAADRHARPRPRQLLRPRGRPRRRHRRPRPARAGARSSELDRAPRRSAGIPLRRVHTVIVTHSHPDHFGGAGLGAQGDRRRHRHPPALPHDLGPRRAAGPRRRGRRRGARRPSSGTTGRGTRRRGAARATASRSSAGCGCAPRARLPRLFSTPTPTVRLDDAQVDPPRRARVGRRCTRPGHTEDHLCLFDPTEGVMLSGDHVLPTITPHIGGFNPQRRPAADVLRVARQGRRLRARRHGRAAGPRPPVRRPRRAGQGDPGAPRRAARAAAPRRPRSSAGRPACRSCRRTCSRPGPRARWPTARRSPTSSTSAWPASSSGASCADGYEYVKPG